MSRVLVLCHLSAVEQAVAAVRREAPDAGIDVLVYGRSAASTPVPAGARLVPLPVLAGSRLVILRELAAFRRSLRRARYAEAVIAQPGFRLSRARGLLVAFPHAVGVRRVRSLDPGSGVSQSVRRGAALGDLALWVALQILGATVARSAGAVLGRAARHEPRRPRPLPASGRALYLRTDIDLVSAPLAAGGSASHTEGVINALRRRDFRVDTWSTGDIVGASGDGLPLRRLPAVVAGNLPTEIGELLSGVWQAVRLLRRAERPDLVYQRYSLNNLAGLVVAARWGVPLVLEANASEAQWRGEWSALAYPHLAHRCERLLLRRADRVTTVSRNAAAGLSRAGVPRERLQVIPNGVDLERFQAAAPAELGFPADAVVFGFSGLFYPWHGMPCLAHAFTRVHRSEPRARLLLVGDGEEMPQVREILARGGALAATRITGLLPRGLVPAHLAAADVLVSPHAPHAAFVGSPIKIFEYLAAGRALIVTAVGQMADVLEDGRTARIVPPGDADALAAAMLELCHDDSLRDRLAAAASVEAARHSWDARIADLLER